jgi:EamA domain-containing membrane protein RarD
MNKSFSSLFTSSVMGKKCMKSILSTDKLPLVMSLTTELVTTTYCLYVVLLMQKGTMQTITWHQICSFSFICRFKERTKKKKNSLMSSVQRWQRYLCVIFLSFFCFKNMYFFSVWEVERENCVWTDWGLKKWLRKLFNECGMFQR